MILQSRLRRYWPLGLLAFGALSMAVFGDLPRSVVGGDSAPLAWQLPAVPAPDTAVAAEAWGSRPPWGGVSPGSVAGPQPQPVGVVQGVRGLEAVFDIPGQALVRLRVGDSLPGGGTVSLVASGRVDWKSADGEAKSRTLLAEHLPDSQDQGAEPASGAQPARRLELGKPAQLRRF